MPAQPLKSTPSIGASVRFRHIFEKKGRGCYGQVVNSPDKGVSIAGFYKEQGVVYKFLLPIADVKAKMYLWDR